MKKILSIISVILIFNFSVNADSSTKINIAVSINPLKFFVDEIVKDRAGVFVVIPANADPHSYEISPSLAKKISNADLYIELGTGLLFEREWITKFANNKKLNICTVSQNIKLIDMQQHVDTNHHEHEKASHGYAAKDPHVWLSPSNAIIISKNILASLIKLDPENKKFYIENANILIRKLEFLENLLHEKLDNINNKSFLVFHPSWGYFANEFGLRQVAIEELGQEPTPKELVKLVEYARANQIKTILAAPQFSKKTALIIANEIDGKVVLVDPLNYDYIQNLIYITKILEEQNG